MVDIVVREWIDKNEVIIKVTATKTDTLEEVLAAIHERLLEQDWFNDQRRTKRIHR